jgi:hypothetical protein
MKEMIRLQELAKHAQQESSQPDLDDFKEEDVIHGDGFSGDFEFDPPKNDPFSQGFSNFSEDDFNFGRIEGAGGDAKTFDDEDR